MIPPGKQGRVLKFPQDKMENQRYKDTMIYMHFVLCPEATHTKPNSLLIHSLKS